VAVKKKAAGTATHKILPRRHLKTDGDGLTWMNFKENLYFQMVNHPSSKAFAL